MEKQKTYTLITGGSMGIGLELARNFARAGHHLILVARHQEELDKAADELKGVGGIEVITIAKDLSEMDQAKALYQETVAKNLKVEILVNNAGQGCYGLFKDTDLKKELAIIHLNICSLVILTKLYMKDMIAAGYGKILNTSSVVAKAPGPWHAVYHATKAFVQSFTEALRAEVKDDGIAVTALLPGATATDFFRKANMLESKAVQDGDLADPAEVAKAGFEALMRNDNMVVSGMKSKMTVAMAAVMPDEKLADQFLKRQAPKSDED